MKPNGIKDKWAWGGLWRGVLSGLCIVAALWLVAPVDARPWILIAAVLLRIGLDLNEASNRKYAEFHARRAAAVEEAERRLRDLRRFRSASEKKT